MVSPLGLEPRQLRILSPTTLPICPRGRLYGTPERTRTSKTLGPKPSDFTYLPTSAWCRRRESNSRPVRYKGTTLTTELHRHYMVVGEGLEPSASPLSRKRSTTELPYSFGCVGRTRTCELLAYEAGEMPLLYYALIFNTPAWTFL